MDIFIHLRCRHLELISAVVIFSAVSSTNQSAPVARGKPRLNSSVVHLRSQQRAAQKQKASLKRELPSAVLAGLCPARVSAAADTRAFA